MENLQQLDLTEDDYVLTRTMIGKGTFGEVHSGYMKDTGEQIAVKEGWAVDLGKEYEMLNSLRGVPFVVQVKGRRVFRNVEGHLGMHIVMERAQDSLADILNDVPHRRGLAAVDIIQLVVHLGRGLKELVDRRIAQRDIKPQNILVFGNGAAPPNSTFTFKLCDFGTSRVAEKGQEMMTIAGTPGYVHPLVFKANVEGRERMSHPYTAAKVDLWSIGSTIYNAATGAIPFPVTERSDVYADRPKGAISALPSGSGFMYFTQIRNDSYPDWLRLALSQMIAAFFDSPVYEDLFSMCRALEQANPKRVVILPSFEVTTMCMLKEPFRQNCPRLGAGRIVIITPNECYFGERIRDFVEMKAPIHGESLLVYSEQSKETDAVDAAPLCTDSLYKSHIQDIFEYKDACDSVIGGYLSCRNIIDAYNATLMHCHSELKSMLREVESRTELTYTLNSIAAALNTPAVPNKFSEIDEHYQKIAGIKDELGAQATSLEEVSKWLTKWEPLDERCIPNLQESMNRLQFGREDEGRVKWAATLRRTLHDRLHDLRSESSENVDREGGVMDVCRVLVKLGCDIASATETVQETAADIEAILVIAQRATKVFLEKAANEPESVIRKNLSLAALAKEKKLAFCDSMEKHLNGIRLNLGNNGGGKGKGNSSP